MPFVTTRPEALSSAASALQRFGTSMAAEDAAGAPATTEIAPAAADPVSALQAVQFAAYGKLYQSVSAHATAINQMLVQTLDTNAGSYGDAEAANQTATGSTSLSGLLGSLTGGSGVTSAAAVPGAGSTAGTSGGAAVFAINGTQNFAAASSDLISMASIGNLPGFGATAAVGSVAGVSGAGGLPVLAGASGGGFGAAPVSAGMGQASSVGGLTVPPTWAAAQGIPAVSTSPPTLAGAGMTSAGPHTAPATTVPAGMPSAASAGRGGYGFGAPRYGVKPTVMPKAIFV